MIYNDIADHVAPNGTLNCDVCIVGAGAAGISMALSLIDAKDKRGRPLDVMVLESSRNNVRRADGSPSNHRYEDPDVQPLYRGEMVPSKATELGQASADEFFLRSRIRCYGGTTNCWEGWTQPLSRIDFDRSASGPSSLCRWPIDLDEMTKHYQTAMERCSLGFWKATDYGNLEFWRKEAKEYAPNPDNKIIDFLKFKDRLCTRAIVRMGGIDYSSTNRIEDGSWDFQNVWNQKIKDAKKVNLYRNANVREILLDSQGRVDKLKVSAIWQSQGKAALRITFFVKAARYVLAASCIENTRLLLHTKYKQPEALGKYLMTHPLVRSAAVFQTNNVVPDSIRRFYAFDVLIFPDELTQIPPVVFGVVVPTETTLREHKCGNFRAWIKFGQRMVDGKPSPADCNNGTVDFNCEQWPNAANKIELSTEKDPLFREDPLPKVTIELKSEDYSTINIGLAEIRKGLELPQDGVYGNTYALPGTFKRFTNDREIVVTGEHAMGTTRMGAVVDTNCQVINLPNVYAVGGSVFPTGGWANPTLTIIALASRLAEHLTTFEY